jgi:hypothetical protein
MIRELDSKFALLQASLMQVDAEGKLSELHTKKKKSGLDTSSPDLQATWTDVLDDASNTDWMTMS